MMTAGRWPWKPASAKECVTAHRPNEAALKMDGAQAGNPDPTPGRIRRGRGVGRRGGCSKSGRRRPEERPLVQILVVVASTQARTLRAEVEKGSVPTAFGHGSVGPKG